MTRVLIIGGSGFLGRALFKELHPYMDVYATYCHQEKYTKNKRYFSYDISEDSPRELLKFIKPHIIISALRGEADAQYVAHDMLIHYAVKNNARLLFLSSANVFDSFRHSRGCSCGCGCGCGTQCVEGTLTQTNNTHYTHPTHTHPHSLRSHLPCIRCAHTLYDVVSFLDRL